MRGGEAQGPVHISFTYTEEEYVRAVRAHFERVYHTRFNFWLGAVVVLLGVLPLALGVDALFPTVCLSVGLLLLAFNFFVYFVTPRRYYEANPKLRERYELDFSDEAIFFRSKGAESRVEWSFYSKFWETPEFYMLVYGKDMFSVIPRRALREGLQEQAFRGMLRRKLGPPAWPRELPKGGEVEPEAEYDPPDSPPDWR